jgi:hypothetical protein
MKTNSQVDIPLMIAFFIFSVVIIVVLVNVLFQKQPSTFINQQKNNTSIKQVQKGASVQLDYNRPIFCDYQTNESSISAFLDTNSVAVTTANKAVIQQYILQGDCLYSWYKNELSGKKLCGMGNSLAIGKQLLGSGLASFDSLMASLPQSGKLTTVDYKAVAKSCKNVAKINKEVFLLPKKIQFK